MCSSNPVDLITTAVAPAVGIPMMLQRKQLDKQAAAQQDAINKQNSRQDELKKQADDLGPAAKAMDLTQDASAYENIKRNKIAMQNGIMGTMKTSSLNAAPASIKKATLGT